MNYDNEFTRNALKISFVKAIETLKIEALKAKEEEKKEGEEDSSPSYIEVGYD